MAGDYPITQIGELASSISETHKFGKEQLIFLNTSDILHGKFLHRTYSAVRDWPGQAKKSIRKDDILFSEIRPANGRWAYVDQEADDFVVSTKLMVIRAKQDRLFPKFLYQFLTSSEITKWLQHLAESRSGTFPQITFDQVATLELPLPPLAEQKAIAAVLGALDDKIELNRRMNATLEAMARALFQSWFIDFDPVRANLDRNQPSPAASRHPLPVGEGRGEGRFALDPATAALFPDSFQESALGEIPHGWRLGTLGELVQLRTDRVDATPAKDSTRYIALEDMPSKSIDLSNFQLGSAVNSSITAFRKGDVLFGSMRPYFHKIGLAFFDGITRTTTFVLRPRKDCFRHFALLHFFSEDVVTHSTTASVGTTIPYVRWDSMESYRIPIPPDALLEAFEKTVSPFVQRIATQGEESRTLATLRDTLLPKLLSGELSVGNEVLQP